MSHLLAPTSPEVPAGLPDYPGPPIQPGVRKIIIGAVVAIGISLGTVQPALAASSSTSQCTQAQGAVKTLQGLADNAKDPKKKQAYRSPLATEDLPNDLGDRIRLG
jgi:hypothetical protein